MTYKLRETAIYARVYTNYNIEFIFEEPEHDAKLKLHVQYEAVFAVIEILN